MDDVNYGTQKLFSRSSLSEIGGVGGGGILLFHEVRRLDVAAGANKVGEISSGG